MLIKKKVLIKITISIVATWKTKKIIAQFVMTINKEFYFLFHLQNASARMVILMMVLEKNARCVINLGNSINFIFV